MMFPLSPHQEDHVAKLIQLLKESRALLARYQKIHSSMQHTIAETRIHLTTSYTYLRGELAPDRIGYDSETSVADPLS
jgi:hypothetical protein